MCKYVAINNAAAVGWGRGGREGGREDCRLQDVHQTSCLHVMTLTTSWLNQMVCKQCKHTAPPPPSPPANTEYYTKINYIQQATKYVWFWLNPSFKMVDFSFFLLNVNGLLWCRWGLNTRDLCCNDSRGYCMRRFALACCARCFSIRADLAL